METSNLIPFVRSNLHILFVGLNPARGSSFNRHYFSVKQSFWDQLYDAGLINSKVDKSTADTLIFGGNKYNHRRWEYGITDLVTAVAESDSSKVKPSSEDCMALSELIQEKSPKVVILLHSKVCRYFLSSLDYPIPPANSGSLGRLIPKCPTQFFNIAFPHGNSINSISKVKNYRDVRNYLETST